MKTLRSLLFLAVAALALLTFTPPAVYADTGVDTVISAGTITNGTTRTTGFTDISVPKANALGVVCRFTGSGTNAVDNIVVTFARSADGVNFETTPRWTWTIPLNATTAVVGYTNLTDTSFGSAAYLRVVSVQNTGNNSVTNFYIETVKKTIKASP